MLRDSRDGGEDMKTRDWLIIFLISVANVLIIHFAFAYWRG